MKVPRALLRQPSHRELCVHPVPAPGKTTARPSQLIWGLAGPKVPGPWASSQPQKQAFCTLVQTLTVQSPTQNTDWWMGDCVHLCFTEKEALKGLDLDQSLSLPESVLKLSQNLHSLKPRPE